MILTARCFFYQNGLVFAEPHGYLTKTEYFPSPENVIIPIVSSQYKATSMALIQEPHIIPSPETRKNTREVHLSLENGYEVIVAPQSNQLFVSDPSGGISLQITMTDQGPLLQMNSAVLNISAEQKLSLSAEEVDIHAKKQLNLRSDGEMTEAIAGDKSSTAEAYDHTARLGDFQVKANDDIKLNGERVKLNCEE